MAKKTAATTVSPIQVSTQVLTQSQKSDNELKQIGFRTENARLLPESAVFSPWTYVPPPAGGVQGGHVPTGHWALCRNARWACVVFRLPPPYNTPGSIVRVGDLKGTSTSVMMRPAPHPHTVQSRWAGISNAAPLPRCIIHRCGALRAQWLPFPALLLEAALPHVWPPSESAPHHDHWRDAPSPSLCVCISVSSGSNTSMGIRSCQ